MLLELTVLQSLLDPWKYSGALILDVGCGTGRVGPVLSCYSELLIGCDIHLPYLRKVKHRVTCYDDVVLCDCTRLPFKDKAFNVSVSVEVIEHLEKHRGLEMLREMERVSSNLTVVVTPNVPSPGGDVEDNPYQRHRSRWRAEDFKRLGYTVRGSGLKHSGLLKRILRFELGLVATIISYYLTKYALNLNAWKYIKRPY